MKSNTSLLYFLFIIRTLLLVQIAKGWVSQSVSLPFIQGTAKQDDKAIEYLIHESFQSMVMAENFLEPCPNKYDSNNIIIESSCTIPVLENAKITINTNSVLGNNPTCDSTNIGNKCNITIQAKTTSDSIYLSQQVLKYFQPITKVLDTYTLRQIIADYYNSLPPHPGYDSSLSYNPHLLEQFLLSSIQSLPHDSSSLFTSSSTTTTQKILQTVKDQGYITLQTNLYTTPTSVQKLITKMTPQKTGQSKSTRSDSVTFLNRNDAMECDLQTQFDFLMSITFWMNEYHKMTMTTLQRTSNNTVNCYNTFLDDCGYDPLPPGSNERPMTNPDVIQAALYNFGEFYKEHSDNSLTETNHRSNYRCYTFILYCNDNWDMKQDGGALRLYLNSTMVQNPNSVLFNEATTSPTSDDGYNYVDINPTNGLLLIFDSRLIHSVQRVTNDTKQRLALTLWNLRPVNCKEIKGEVYDAGEAKVTFI